MEALSSLTGLAKRGYCAPTKAFAAGDCAVGGMGTWPLNGLTPLANCVQRCAESCARCRFVSYSVIEAECSWYHDCDIERLQTRHSRDHQTLAVASLAWAALKPTLVSGDGGGASMALPLSQAPSTPNDRARQTPNGVWRARRLRLHGMGAGRSVSGAHHSSTAQARLGYCGSAKGVGDCQAGRRGSWELTASETADLVTARSACQRRCEACGRCRYISYSVVWKDCTWYRKCDLEAVCHTGFKPRTSRPTICYSHVWALPCTAASRRAWLPDGRGAAGVEHGARLIPRAQAGPGESVGRPGCGGRDQVRRQR